MPGVVVSGSPPGFCPLNNFSKRKSAIGLHSLIIDALATHRITHLITEDEFPFGPARDRILASQPNSMIATWVTCPWCSGLWCAAGVVAARALAPRWWTLIATALSLSSITGLLATWENSK